MLTRHKTQSALLTYWFEILLLCIGFALYGGPAIEWILMKLYQLFIQAFPNIL